MPDAVPTQSRKVSSWLTLNGDGQSHPVLNGLTAFTFVGGIVAFACGLIVAAHLAATVLGIAGMVVGMGTQLNSATREQRIFIVAGIIASFVGIAMGVTHGGFRA